MSGLEGEHGVGPGHDASLPGGGGSVEPTVEGPSFAEKMVSRLRSHIESGQINIGAGGPGSNNAIVNPPIRNPNQPQPPPDHNQDPGHGQGPSLSHPDSAAGDKPWASRSQDGIATVVPVVAPVSPRAAHAAAAAAHAEARRRRRALEDAKHNKEREDKLTRYLVLIICIVVIIASLLGMAAISRRVIGKWWHGQPDPLQDNSSTKISHTPLFPFSKTF
jgi:hypothetical protein